MRISAVRAFNRFYTRQLGVLGQRLLESPFSLSEARVLYELAHRNGAAAKELGVELDLDAGYLSRIVQKFADDGLITRKPLPEDRRQHQLNLTAKGRQAFAKLDRRSHEDVARMLGRMSEIWACDLARTAARRHGLGGAESWRAICRRVWLRFFF
jgi:DNA-binding MarR family transcriptional regulator